MLVGQLKLTTMEEKSMYCKICTMPLYSEEDAKNLSESVKKARKEGFDIISLSSYLTNSCVVLVFNQKAVEAITTAAKKWRKWEITDDNPLKRWRLDHWKTIVPDIKATFEVSGSFEVDVERKLKQLKEITFSTFWDISRERQ